MALQLPGNEISDDNTARISIYHDQIQHFTAREHPDLADSDLPHEGTVCPEKELLSGLSSCIESSGDLGSSKRTVSKISGIFPAPFI